MVIRRLQRPLSREGFGHAPLPPFGPEAAFVTATLCRADLEIDATGHTKLVRENKPCFRTGFT